MYSDTDAPASTPPSGHHHRREVATYRAAIPATASSGVSMATQASEVTPGTRTTRTAPRVAAVGPQPSLRRATTYASGASRAEASALAVRGEKSV